VGEESPAQNEEPVEKKSAGKESADGLEAPYCQRAEEGGHRKDASGKEKQWVSKKSVPKKKQRTTREKLLERADK